MSSGSHSEPDLTPMLDMVFQLITFFMLVMTLKSKALDLDMKLPVVGSARPVDTKGREELLIVNIDTDGMIKSFGVRREPRAFAANEAMVSRLSPQNRGMNLKAGDELPTRIVIRSDENTKFGMIYKVIQDFQEQGFINFALRSGEKG
jgi:biopolymer transport protein ExbD